MTDFPALPGFYRLLFLHIEPVSTILPAVLAFIYPGAEWFYKELIPHVSPALVGTGVSGSGAYTPGANMAVYQLTNCYLLLGLISSLVFRAVRDALPGNPVAQERILGASLLALAIADVTHIIVTLVGLPPDLRTNFSAWNGTTHGNITFVVLLFSVRAAWFLGIGRKRYYFGQTLKKSS